MRQLSDLKDKFIDRPAVIMGGGPSLASDMAKIEACTIADAILFAVNQHAFALIPPDHIDYVVFMDDPVRMKKKADAGIPGAKRDRRLEQCLNHHARISQITDNSDFELPPGYWDGGFSSSLATWAALYIGCNPVILCGMDLYQGERQYIDDSPRSAVADHPLENHLKAWRRAFDNCQHPERIKAVSGPLKNVFGGQNA